MRINGAIFAGNASMNTRAITKPDFTVGDELQLQLEQPLRAKDRISVVSTFGPKQCFFLFTERKIRCRCGYRGVEQLDFVDKYSPYAKRFEDSVSVLCEKMTITDAASVAVSVACGDDGIINTATVLGNFDEPTDACPNGSTITSSPLTTQFHTAFLPGLQQIVWVYDILRTTESQYQRRLSSN